jgi:GTP-binding protein EngB required for normal cell division
MPEAKDVFMKISDDEKLQAILNAYKSKFGPVQDQKFTFLLVGRTGVGKSSSVNSLMDKEVAAVGDYVPTTMTIESFDNETFGIKFTVVDTPGLCDDLEEEGKDEIYLERIRAQVPKIDCLWFVTRLDDTRVSSDEKRAIRLIPAGCGKDIWERAIIVFTYANAVNKDKYQEALKKRAELIRLEIARWTSPYVAAKVPAVAIDNKARTTPDEKEWLGDLYVTVFTRVSDHGFLPFVLATAERLVLPSRGSATPQAHITYSYPSYNYYYPSSSSGHSTRRTSSSDSSGYTGQGTRPIVISPEHRDTIAQRFSQSISEYTAKGGNIGQSIAGDFGGTVGKVAGGVYGAGKAAVKEVGRFMKWAFGG